MWGAVEECVLRPNVITLTRFEMKFLVRLSRNKYRASAVGARADCDDFFQLSRSPHSRHWVASVDALSLDLGGGGTLVTGGPPVVGLTTHGPLTKGRWALAVPCCPTSRCRGDGSFAPPGGGRQRRRRLHQPSRRQAAEECGRGGKDRGRIPRP